MNMLNVDDFIDDWFKTGRNINCKVFSVPGFWFCVYGLAGVVGWFMIYYHLSVFTWVQVTCFVIIYRIIEGDIVREVIEASSKFAYSTNKILCT